MRREGGTERKGQSRMWGFGDCKLGQSTPACNLAWTPRPGPSKLAAHICRGRGVGWESLWNSF